MTSTSVRLLAVAGSLREASLNRRLIRAMATMARDDGAEVTLIDLKDYALPLYDGGIEAAGMPAAVRELQDLMAQHDALLLATPEYNGAVPAVVKNTLDWISRAQLDGSPGSALFRGKVAGICAASPGSMGGIRALLTLRDMLAKLGFWVAPSQVAVGGADKALSADGEIILDSQRAAVARVVNEVLMASRAFRQPIGG